MAVFSSGLERCFFAFWATGNPIASKQTTKNVPLILVGNNMSIDTIIDMYIHTYTYNHVQYLWIQHIYIHFEPLFYPQLVHYLKQRYEPPTLSHCHAEVLVREETNLCRFAAAQEFHFEVVALAKKWPSPGVENHTLWLCQNSYWKWPSRNIVDLPIKNGDFP